MFKEQGSLNEEALRSSLEALLRCEIRQIETTFISSGYTRGVYKMETILENETILPLVIKRTSNPHDWTLYEEFLEPFRLNSPAYLGQIEIESEMYLVMERIPIKEVPHETWLNHALRWLIRKDTICHESIAKIREMKSIGPRMGNGSKWWSLINECARMQLHPAITVPTYEKLKTHKETLERYTDRLHSSRQTVVHNDFQKRNTLISEEGRFYVIDWSYPQIGSPLIDLDRLIRMSPAEETAIISEYQRHIPIENFDQLLSMAKFRNDLSLFAWMCKATSDGQKQTVDKEFNVAAHVEGLLAHKPIV